MIQDMKKARPNAATLERTAEPEANNHESPESTLKHTTSSPPGQVVHIADFLSSGEEHAIPMRHLRKLIHLPARTIRLMIRAERLSGTPILENSKSGYYLPADARERAQCVRRLLHRAKEIELTARAIEGADI